MISNSLNMVLRLGEGQMPWTFFLSEPQLKTTVGSEFDKNQYNLSKIDVFWWKTTILDHCASIRGCQLIGYWIYLKFQASELILNSIWGLQNYRIEKLVKLEWSYGKTLCRSLLIISAWPLCDLTSFSMRTHFYYLILDTTNFWLLNLEFAYEAMRWRA